jgi:four helix bundle protein
MTPHELRERTKRFAIEIIRSSASLPRTDVARLIRAQLVRAGTAVGANYRAVCRSRSNRDFVAKLGVVIEEADETSYWLEILLDAEIVTASAVSALRREADELTRIFVTSRVTARKNARRAADRGPTRTNPEL